MNHMELDVHTHTLVSGHAYATIDEMVRSAAEKGLKLLGITEHAAGVPGTCQDIYFENLKILPRKMHGISVMFGAETNIIDYEGRLGTPQHILDVLDIRIAGMHGVCYTAGTAKENTAAMLCAIKNPSIDIISHPVDGNFPIDYEQVVAAAQQYHTLLEINNHALRSLNRKNVLENTMTLLSLCREKELPVLFSSDAHTMYDVANFTQIEKVLALVDFPMELVINRSKDDFCAFLAENRRREAQQKQR